MSELLHILLHINDYLDLWIQNYGGWLYLILFAIIFVETGLVLMPFLPGDSLLFAAGALCARIAHESDPAISILPMIFLLSVAAILGDHSNYFIGRMAGTRILGMQWKGKKIIQPKYVDQTEQFFSKYGTKAIVLARFVPIVRTFTPFVAGIGKMDYMKKFMPYDIFGGILWISSMSTAGYILGSNEWVKKHFEAVVIGIVVLSISPMIFAYLKHRLQKSKG
jgi:membrane-associated protein